MKCSFLKIEKNFVYIEKRLFKITVAFPWIGPASVVRTLTFWSGLTFVSDGLTFDSGGLTFVSGGQTFDSSSLTFDSGGLTFIQSYLTLTLCLCGFMQCNPLALLLSSCQFIINMWH